MNWNNVLDDWGKGRYYKYPDKIKNKFIWNTSVIKNNGNSKFIEKFLIHPKLPTEQNYNSFKSYIEQSKNKYVVSFYNLNKDTLLVIPIPRKNKNYSTIKDFCDNASVTQKKYFWKTVSKLIKNYIKKHKYVWVSAHGLGVPYMHIRISNKPKYYFSKTLMIK